MSKRGRVDGLQATYAAMEESKRGPIPVELADEQAVGTGLSPPAPLVGKRTQPRVRKPRPGADRCVAPPGVDLEDLRARLREAFGNTLSDEFAQVMMRKLIDALAPSPHDELDEATLNAGLALISSMRPQSELEALLAVQIVATGFSGLRFLRESHRQMGGLASRRRCTAARGVGCMGARLVRVDPRASATAITGTVSTPKRRKPGSRRCAT